MKQVSDEALARRIEGANARIKENPLSGTDYENLTIFEELQAWRAAFKGVEMVVPVEWNTVQDIEYLASAKAKGFWMAYRELSKKTHLEDKLGVIRLDEIFGTEGTK